MLIEIHCTKLGACSGWVNVGLSCWRAGDSDEWNGKSSGID